MGHTEFSGFRFLPGKLFEVAVMAGLGHQAWSLRAAWHPHQNGWTRLKKPFLSVVVTFC